MIASTVQLKVQSGFWLVLTEKSDSGFPIVNPAYGDRTKTSHVPLALLYESQLGHCNTMSLTCPRSMPAQTTLRQAPQRKSCSPVPIINGIAPLWVGMKTTAVPSAGFGIMFKMY